MKATYIEGFEGRYTVTDDGRVYSLLRRKFLVPMRCGAKRANNTQL